jgi:drug/metabolite transporter (DMT)-like permease
VIAGRSLRLRAELALALIAFIWGATFIIVKQALADISPVLFLAIRFTSATLLLMIVFRGRWIPPAGSRPRAAKAGLALGVCLISGYILQTIGLQYTTASKAGFITGFYIPLVPFLGMFVYRFSGGSRSLRIAWPRPIESAGTLVATAGMILMTLPDERIGIGQGDLLVLASTFAYAVQIQLLAKWTGSLPFETITVLQIGAAAVLAWLACPVVEAPRFAMTSAVVFALVTSAVFATAVAFGLQSWAQQHTTATRSALIFALEPVFAWLTAFAAVRETLTVRAGLGAIAILAGILLVELKPGLPSEHPMKRVDACD